MIKVGENGKGRCWHPDREVIRVMLPHYSPRAPRCAIAERLPLQQHDLATPLLCQVIGDAGAHHSSPNNDYIGCLSHCCSPLEKSLLALEPYLPLLSTYQAATKTSRHLPE